MSLDKWNKAVDEWVARENKRAGEIFKAQVGMYPPRNNGLIVSEFGINNKLATADLIRHYADAIGDTNPLWRFEDYARNTRHGGIIAPPKFIDCISPTYGVGGYPYFKVPGMNCLNSGSKHTWYQTIRPGDEFTLYDKFLGVTEVTRKDRPMPRLFLFQGIRSYVNQRKEVVATAQGGAIIVGSGPELQGPDPTFANIKRHKYTEVELKEIDRAYDKEKRRGSNVLYWEDVKEGEEIPTIVTGPLTLMDSIAFFHAVGYTTAFAVDNALLRENSDFQIIDPETNVPLPAAMVHASDSASRVQGMPYAVGFAAQSEGNIVHMICNWMGDDGFLVKLDCQSRRINIVGDMNWIKGKVTKKYIHDEDHLVELSVWAENQDHIIHMPGTAVVRLFSRK